MSVYGHSVFNQVLTNSISSMKPMALSSLKLTVTVKVIVLAMDAVPDLLMRMVLHLVMFLNPTGTRSFSTLTPESVHTIFLQGIALVISDLCSD